MNHLDRLKRFPRILDPLPAGSLSILLGLLLMAAGGACTSSRNHASKPSTSIVLASTTSTQNSGLLDFLLPLFTDKSGIEVPVVAVGTGQAFRLARRGDADVLLVHDRPAEERFVAQGEGLIRRAVMHNDFVLIGPAADPAGLAGSTDILAAFRKIAARKALFVSRGDDSGTDRREKSIWREAKIQPETGASAWYRAAGAGRRARRVHPLGPRHLGGLRQPRAAQDPCGGRSPPGESVRDHPGQSGPPSRRPRCSGTGPHRLAGLTGGPNRHRLLPDLRARGFLPRCCFCSRWRQRRGE
ncbi:MAG: substrate-binding domain-containing protein, partial [Acidobacteriota bacterium]